MTDLINATTGRPAYTGPLGEPGSATPFAGATQWQNPVNGQTMYYVAGSTPDPGNVAALSAAGYTPAAVVGTYEGYPENPGGGPAAGFPGSAPLGSGPQGPGTATATTQDQQNQAAQQNALGILENELTGWGFGADALAWAQGEIQSNRSLDEILFDLRQQPFYVNSIFGQTNTARRTAGLPVMSETDILSYKNTAQSAAEQAGLPQGFITDAELSQLMGHDVSASELSDRITNGYVAALQAPPDVLNHLQTYYGVTPGNLAAYYLDPTKGEALLQRQFATAQIGGMASLTGYGNIDLNTATYLQSLGVTKDQAAQGFSQLGQESQIFNPLPGETKAPVDQSVQLGAEFAQNAEDVLAVRRAQQARLSPFQGGGGFASTGQGLTGVGGAGQPG